MLPQRRGSNSSTGVEQNDLVKPRLSEAYPLFPLSILLPWDLRWFGGQERPSVLLQGLWCGQHQHINLILTLGDEPFLFPTTAVEKAFWTQVKNYYYYCTYSRLRIKTCLTLCIKLWCVTHPRFFVSLKRSRNSQQPP